MSFLLWPLRYQKQTTLYLSFCAIFGLALPVLAQPTSEPSSLPAGDSIDSIELQLDAGSTLTPDLIRELLQQKTGAPLNEEAIREDINSIFALGAIFDVQVELISPHVLKYTIQELPQNIDFEIKGIKPKDLGVREYIPGRYFYNLDIFGTFRQSATLQELKNTDIEVQDTLRRLGYMNATVETDVQIIKGDKKDAPLEKILVVYTLSSGNKFSVSGVLFSGNKEFSSREIEEQFVTKNVKSNRRKKKYGHFSQSILDDDIISLKAKYLERGYLDSSVEIKTLAIDEKLNTVKIFVDIKEGEQYKVEAVSADFEKAKDLKIKTGKIYDTSKVKEDIQLISLYFQNKGYANVSVTPELNTNREKKNVSVNYKVEKGELFYFGKIKKEFTDIERAPSDKFIEFKTGELYSQEKIERTKKNLESTQNLDSVKITTEMTTQPNVLDVTIESSFRDIFDGHVLANSSLEKPYWIYHRGTANNWLGYRNIVETQYRLFDNERTFALGVSRFFARGAGLSLSGFHSEYEWPLQTYQKRGGALQLSQRFSNSWSGALVYFLYQNRSKVSSAVLPVSLDGDGRRATLLAMLTFDTRDFGPRGDLEHAGGFVGRGWYLSAQAELDAAWLGSTQELFGARLRAARYFTLRDGGRQANVPGGITLKLVGRYDRRWSRSEREIPYTERFLLGGIGAVRGFALQSLGTEIEESGRRLSIGGAQAYSGTIELEFPFVDEFVGDEWRRLRWALFVDAGRSFDVAVPGFTVVPAPQDFGRLPVRTSAGVSLRWYVSFLGGPMRFDLARPLDAQPGEGFQGHFSISTEL